MSIEAAQREAVRRAVNELQSVDLAARCERLGLPIPNTEGLHFRAFGQNLVLRLPGYELVDADNGQPAKLRDQILVLHYLRYQRSIHPTGDLISFRELPGGQFYWEAFCGRSIAPVLKRIGNDTELLKRHLGRFDWQPFESGDLGARIHGIGHLDAFLIYRRGDEECEPTADVLFDRCIKQVYAAEDAVVFASRICLGLL